MERLGLLNDATTADIDSARKAVAEATLHLEPVTKFLDLLALQRSSLTGLDVTLLGGIDDAARKHDNPEHQQLLEQLNIKHLPIVFPEVFTGHNPGFSCLSETRHGKKQRSKRGRSGRWWSQVSGQAFQRRIDARIAELAIERPNEHTKFIAQKSSETYNKVLLAGAYPGMEEGDPDLYKAFSWRFWLLLQDQGVLGIVLLVQPSLARAEPVAPNSSTLRLHGITQLLNNGVGFSTMSIRNHTIALISIRKQARPMTKFSCGDRSTRSNGTGTGSLSPDASRRKDYHVGRHLLISAPAKRQSDRNVIKMRSTPTSMTARAKVSRSARSGNSTQQTTARPVTSQLTSTTHPMVHGQFKGASFLHWEPDTGIRFGWAVPKMRSLSFNVSESAGPPTRGQRSRPL